jgi:hypothetical protein
MINMTQQEIQERNIEIAKMICKYDEESLRYIFKNKMWNNFTYGVSERHHQEQLCFHVNYDWLMEAIQFLKKDFESKDRYWTTIERYPLYSNIEDVFVVVSDFAKLYNNKEL